MPHVFSHYKIINFSLVVLAFFVLALTAEVTWISHFDYRTVRDMNLANTMADHLIRASGDQAIERGRTASALGSSVPASPITLKNIAQLREKGDADWNQALVLARDLAAQRAPDSEFTGTIEQAEQAHATLVQARARADWCMQGKACAYTATQWIDTISHFIAVASRLREAAFLPMDTPRHVAQLNLLLKRWVWLASEYAGRERGILGYYVSARQPLPPAVP
jgi:hypothetical protein